MVIERIFRSTKNESADTGNACGHGLRHGLSLKRARCQRLTAVPKLSKGSVPRRDQRAERPFERTFKMLSKQRGWAGSRVLIARIFGPWR